MSKTETFSEEKLKRDFGEYGDIAFVNFLKEKNCAFVNFTNINNAIKAVEDVRNKHDYANLKLPMARTIVLTHQDLAPRSVAACDARHLVTAQFLCPLCPTTRDYTRSR